MLQPRGDFDFPRKAFRPDLRRELGVHDFNRDLAVVFYVLGAKHGGHAPAPQLAVHGVGVSERVAQRGQQFRQDIPPGETPSVASSTWRRQFSRPALVQPSTTVIVI